MGGLNGVLGTDLSGLEAYRAALNTVSENVSNEGTTGYARRSTELASRFQGAEQVSGTGVDVQGIQRISSNFADARVRASTAKQGHANALVNAMSELQSNFPSNGGISKALSQFFSDAKNLSTQPANKPARQTLIADGQQLSSSFRQVAGNINDSINNLTQRGQELTKQANQYLQQLSTLNQQLRSRDGKNTNSLLDNQSAVLQKLSKIIGVHVLRHSNGTVRLSVRGQVLLGTSGASKLSLNQKPNTPAQLQLPNGHSLNTTSTRGELGGTLSALAQSQAQLQNINRMATVTAGLVNNQQALGLTANGNQGSALFTMPTPTVVANPVNGGAETLNASLQDPTQLPANGGPYTLRYNGTQWQATNHASGKTLNLGSGSTLNFKGIQVNVSGGAPSAGDTFTLNPVAGAAEGMRMTTSNPDKIAASAPYVSTPGTLNPATGAVTDTNSGSGVVHAGKVTNTPGSGLKVPGSNFGQSLVVKFTSPTTYEVKSQSTGNVVDSGSYSASSGGSVSVTYPSNSGAGGKYWTMNISGQPAKGDMFTLSKGGQQSGENADALGQLNTANVLPGGNLNDAWSYVTGSIGSAVSSAKTAQSNANTSVKNAKATRNAVSGVSLDKQAGQLQRYTQAYQASAKAIATVNKLFQSLINVV